jgi:hypothetical protein
VRLFSRHQGELLAFFTTMATTDVVAPPTGTHTLEAHFRELAGGPAAQHDERLQHDQPETMESRSSAKGAHGPCS